MQLLTKHTDFAIRALLMLAGQPDTYLSARRIADDQQIPYQFLRGLLQELSSEGLVRSRCVLRHQIMRIEGMVSREFDQITIGSLLDDLHAVNRGNDGNRPAPEEPKQAATTVIS